MTAEASGTSSHHTCKDSSQTYKAGSGNLPKEDETCLSHVPASRVPGEEGGVEKVAFTEQDRKGRA